MSDTKTVVVKSSTSILGPLFLIMFVLKVLSIEPVSTWSWWVITAPLWAPWVAIAGIALAIGVLWCVVYGIAWALDKMRVRRRGR